MPSAPPGPPAGGGGGAAKTMFGYAAPVIQKQPPGAPPAGAPPQFPPMGQPPGQPGFPPAPQQPGFPPQQGYQPPQQPGFPPAPQQPGYPPAPQQGGFQPPGMQQPGYPPAPQQGGFQPPPQQPSYPPVPQQGGFQPPGMQQPGYPPAPQQGGFQPPVPQQPGYPPQPQGGFQPPPQQGYQPPAPPQPGYPPQPQGGYQQPPPQQGYQPPQQGYQPPQQGYQPPPQQPGYPQQPNPFGAPQQDLPGPLDNLARGLPESAPGTIFGVQISKLRDAGLQRKALFVLGIAIAASAFIPLNLDMKIWPWDSLFRFMLWPLLAGGAYLLVAAAPPHIRQKVPPVALQWLPFGVAFLGIQFIGLGIMPIYHMVAASPRGGGDALMMFAFDGMPDTGYLYSLGMATLIFGLLSRIQNPNDQIARIIMAVGAGALLMTFLFNLGTIGSFGIEYRGFKKSMFFLGLHNHVYLLVLLLGALTLLYLVPPAKLPPALKAIDSLAPMIAAVLILWLPLQVVLMFLTAWMDMEFKAVDAIIFLARGLVVLAGYFGVLMLTAPAAYDEFMKMFKKGGSPPPPAQQAGGYPPPPPPGGGYPPPPGGGYPPPGGGYPQQ